MKIALVGATGLVGSVMIQVLEKSKLKIDAFYAVASERSIGKTVMFNKSENKVIGLDEAVALAPDIAIFSAGGTTSKIWAPKFAAQGTVVIDNSSAWRMDKEIPLVVPEINGGILTKKHKIIANPNCSTIQMVMALAPLHSVYEIDRLVVSTYQSVTGSGAKAVRQMQDERICRPEPQMFYHYPIDLNVIPHGGDFLENGYTTEEEKLVFETRKILANDNLRITATVVRVPVFGGHSESVNVEFKKEFELTKVFELLENFPGIVVQDNVEQFQYPMPRFAEGKDAVFVGRIRRDFSQDKTLNLWIVSDNLRKGAATNAVQIAEYLTEHHLIEDE
ncbi:MAG TPA: aspartate-semialdehyde dehydrogenase [Bacteroidales bacterium]|nr:aspartate-semialdehyde dehydrogenase [Bacteroidales bacterium]